MPLTSSFTPINIRVYCSQNPIPAERLWLAQINTTAGENKHNLSAYIKECEVIKIPEIIWQEDWKSEGALMKAACDGIRCLPTVLLLDGKNRVFARIEGGTTEQNLEKKLALFYSFIMHPRPVFCINRIKQGTQEEQSKQICSYLAHVPVERWFVDYPRTMKRLEKLQSKDKLFISAKEAKVRLAGIKHTAELIQLAFDVREPQEIRHCIELWRQKIDEPGTPTEDKQRYLLALIHPLWIRLESCYYDGGHVPESEDAFAQAIKTLEEARDINAHSPLGKKADYLREELRKARLSAAKYD